MTSPIIEGYIVAERIGSGSYSSVYKAFKKGDLRETVAIKCVEKGKLSKCAVENIVTEITLLKVLKHDNIVEMKDFQWDERFIYIIMEFCDGGDLSCFIRKRRKLPETACQMFLQQLAIALKFLRSQNVCHMDLKPQNLLLMTKPKLCLKLGDFGLAQYLSPDDCNSSLRGSPLYMAPEMLMKQKYDARVDLWSVGIIMYECLFGRAPYSSSSFEELAEKIKAQTPIQIPPGSVISSECADLLNQLLQHKPNQRIDYEAFFQHPFLDLEHYPSSESYDKALLLIKDAVKCDSNKNYKEAFNLYCEALKYFIPLVNDETDLKKQTVFRSKVNSYIARAEDIKQLLLKDGAHVKYPHQNDDSFKFSELCHLCSTSPSLAAALEIGNAAQQYMAEGQYPVALEKYEACLGVLVPALSKEPKGRRRDFLHYQIEQWLKEAETTKTFLTLTTKNFPENHMVETKEWCRTQ